MGRGHHPENLSRYPGGKAHTWAKKIVEREAGKGRCPTYEELADELDMYKKQLRDAVARRDKPLHARIRAEEQRRLILNEGWKNNWLADYYEELLQECAIKGAGTPKDIAFQTDCSEKQIKAWIAGSEDLTRGNERRILSWLKMRRTLTATVSRRVHREETYQHGDMA